ncbi:MAG: hypothetical protein ACI8ZM_000074 [Crocinitomix sp.]|jgi:hypothetical protein
MANELWGTLSIYDHRDAIFVKSLILFDRLVIPVPNKPIGDLTVAEIDQLYSNASYLEKHNAAIIYDWDSAEFQNWQAEYSREALSIGSRDSLYDSRLLLQRKTDELKPDNVHDVISVPVYSARKKFVDAYKIIDTYAQEAMSVELSQLISVPSENTPLESIIALRNKPSFQSARRALRDWQITKMPEVLGEKSTKNIGLAIEDYQRMLGRYEEEMHNAKFKKKKVIVTSMLTLGSIFSAALGQTQTAIALFAGAAPNLFNIKEAFTPTWKSLRDKDYEAGGVIYEANKLLK